MNGDSQLESARHQCSTKFRRSPALPKEFIMQGSQKVIDALNAGLTIELTAINQYFIQAKMCKNWGLNRLGAKHYSESMGEMKHAEMLIDRILFLEGVPEIARYDVIRAGTDVQDQFQYDLTLETNGVKAYNAAVQLCIDENDGGSRELLEKILVESEEHVDWLETQIDLIQRLGLQNYLITQVGEEEAGGH
jgi:bacterioferritin